MYSMSPSTLCGYPVHVNNHMEDIATANKPIIFGDLTKHLIRFAGTVTIKQSMELHAINDQITFIGFQRMDSNTLNAGTNPIKHIVMA